MTGTLGVESRVVWTGELVIGQTHHLRIGRAGSMLVAEFAEAGTLRVAADGSSFEFQPMQGSDAALTTKFHRGLADAMVRHARGKLTLHGSAVTRAGRTVAMLGDSGLGKSTLAAALCRQPDIALSADDTVALEFGDSGIAVLPTQDVSWLAEPSLRYFGEHGNPSSKTPIAPSRRATAPGQLVAVALLAFDSVSTPMVRMVTGHEALGRIVRSAIRLILDDPLANEREFEQICCLMKGGNIVEITRPPGLHHLPATMEIVRRMLEVGE